MHKSIFQQYFPPGDTCEMMEEHNIQKIKITDDLKNNGGTHHTQEDWRLLQIMIYMQQVA